MIIPELILKVFSKINLLMDKFDFFYILKDIF